jgi:hypothetical protein
MNNGGMSQTRLRAWWAVGIWVVVGAGVLCGRWPG